ncbi:MAG: NfeD family protein [Clostridiales bacterium]|nr:NfeD family protein [Clostridiales bacterium]
MLYIVVTVAALLATILITVFWDKLTDWVNGAILGIILIGNVLWLLYCAWQVTSAIYRFLTRIAQAVFDHRYLIILGAAIFLIAALKVIQRIMAQENDGFYGNGDGFCGGEKAIVKNGITETQPVGMLLCSNSREWRCISEDGQSIPAGTWVELVRLIGNKLVVRPWMGPTSVK